MAACASLFTFGPAHGQTSVAQKDSTAQVVYKLRNLHTEPFFYEVIAASCIAWVLGLVKGLGTTKDWLGNYWNQVPAIVLILGDLLLFGVVGGYIGTAIYEPDSLIKALAAGITWPIGLGVISKKGGV